MLQYRWRESNPIVDNQFRCITYDPWRTKYTSWICFYLFSLFVAQVQCVFDFVHWGFLLPGRLLVRALIWADVISAEGILAMHLSSVSIYLNRSIEYWRCSSLISYLLLLQFGIVNNVVGLSRDLVRISGIMIDLIHLDYLIVCFGIFLFSEAFEDNW